MKTTTAVKKLEKLTNKVTKDGRYIKAIIGDQEINLIDQEGEVIIISTKKTYLKNNSISDTFYDTYHKSLKAAIEWINN